MATYIKSSGEVVDMTTMHPSYLINAFNKKVRQLEAASQVQSEQLRLLGEMALTLKQKGFVFEARLERNGPERP